MYLIVSWIDFDAVETIVLLHLDDDLLALAGSFIHSNDAIKMPIGDVNDVFENDKRKRLANESRTDCSHVSAIEGCVLNVIQKGVAPVESVGVEINCQSVGPAE